MVVEVLNLGVLKVFVLRGFLILGWLFLNKDVCLVLRVMEIRGKNKCYRRFFDYCVRG